MRTNEGCNCWKNVWRTGVDYLFIFLLLLRLFWLEDAVRCLSTVLIIASVWLSVRMFVLWLTSSLNFRLVSHPSFSVCSSYDWRWHMDQRQLWLHTVGDVSPCNRPWRPIVRRRGSHIFYTVAHRWRWGCQRYAPAVLYPQEDSWYGKPVLVVEFLATMKSLWPLKQVLIKLAFRVSASRMHAVIFLKMWPIQVYVGDMISINYWNVIKVVRDFFEKVAIVCIEAHLEGL
jgi:hypothetical protein